MWRNGVVVCINEAGQWSLTNAGPPLQDSGSQPTDLVASGTASMSVTSWHTLSLHIEGASASAKLDGEVLFADVAVRDIDTGFTAIGANGWFPVEYRNLVIKQAASGWEPPVTCVEPSVGAVLSAGPCMRNGIASADQSWNLLPSFQLQHAASGLCAKADVTGPVTLAECETSNGGISAGQLFVNDYTRIRNKVMRVVVSSVNLPLSGKKSGEVAVDEWKNADWNSWSYFPNTRQLRNQYTTDTSLGYPMCLSTCPPSETTSVTV
jgi:hypothetical protein